MVRTARVLGILILALSLFPAMNASAATEFCNSTFKAAYSLGESIAPNFWGPLEHASDCRTQDYTDTPGGQRDVQYFDKARMEITRGQLTFGLLATEMVTGRIQVGDRDFINQDPSTTPVAGDEDGGGPSYATIYDNGKALMGGKAQQTGQPINLGFTASNNLVTLDDPSLIPLTDYDSVTRHNVVSPFTRYRDLVGFSTIGYAITEPFAANFTVGGVQRVIAVQVFERRILTYTPRNPDPFKVEMGNIGRHYFYWRNGR
ncbi:MAG: hypothetical protein ACR2M3_21845 [Thermomicrobiales bacterium]